MGQRFLQGAVLLQQLHRRFVPDARHPGNIVAPVPGQALPVRHLLRGEAVFLIDLFRREADGFADSLPGEHQLHAAAHQLQRVPVPRQQQRRGAGVRPLPAQRSQQIIRLPSRDGEAGNAHLVQQGPDRPQLLNQLRRRCVPPGLVFRVDRMPEGRPVLIEAYRQILHVFLPDDLQQHAHEAVNRVGIHTVRVHQRKRVKSPVHQAVPVHNQKSILHSPVPFRFAPGLPFSPELLLFHYIIFFFPREIAP